MPEATIDKDRDPAGHKDDVGPYTGDILDSPINAEADSTTVKLRSEGDLRRRVAPAGGLHSLASQFRARRWCAGHVPASKTACRKGWLMIHIAASSPRRP